MKSRYIVLLAALALVACRDYEKEPLTPEEIATAQKMEAEDINDEAGIRWSLRRPASGNAYVINEFTPRESPHMSCVIASLSGYSPTINCFPKEKK